MRRSTPLGLLNARRQQTVRRMYQRHRESAGVERRAAEQLAEQTGVTSRCCQDPLQIINPALIQLHYLLADGLPVITMTPYQQQYSEARKSRKLGTRNSAHPVSVRRSIPLFQNSFQIEARQSQRDRRERTRIWKSVSIDSLRTLPVHGIRPLADGYGFNTSRWYASRAGPVEDRRRIKRFSLETAFPDPRLQVHLEVTLDT